MAEPEWAKSRIYPVITYTDGGEVRQSHVEAAGRGLSVRLETLADEELPDKLEALLAGGGCAGIVVNTVTRAQALWRALSERMGRESVRLLHSRFLSRDRVEKEWELRECLGPPDRSRRPDRLVVIGTQVMEQSLDVDFVVGQTWAKKGANFFLLDQIRDRLSFTGSKNAVLELSRKWPKAYQKLIEDKANGPAVMDALKDAVSGLIPVEPYGSKVARAHAVTPLWEAGNVYIPHSGFAGFEASQAIVNNYARQLRSLLREITRIRSILTTRSMSDVEMLLKADDVNAALHKYAEFIEPWASDVEHDIEDKIMSQIEESLLYKQLLGTKNAIPIKDTAPPATTDKKTGPAKSKASKEKDENQGEGGADEGGEAENAASDGDKQPDASASKAGKKPDKKTKG